MSDDTDSNVVHLPTRGSDSGGMPDAPDGGDLFYSEPPASNAGSTAPPESPQETTLELPTIREPISPEVALRETGIPDAPDIGGDGSESGEYVQPRSLADRLGDWLELRLQMARDRQAGEAPFREAEIARKTKLLEACTAQETAMMEQNAKLQAAQAKAKSDKAAARGKADAAQSSSSGMGADKGRSKAGGGGGSRGGGGSSGGSGRGSGGGRGAGPNGSGGSGRGTGGGSSKGSGGGSSPKGAGKGSDRSAGGRGGGAKGNESSGGGKGRQNGSGGSGSGKAGTGKGSSGGSGSKNGSGGTGSGKAGTGKGSSGGSGGKNGSGGTGAGKGGSKGDGGTSKDSPAASPRAERARGRQERAAARQAARHQRRSADQAAKLADRSKDRDQDRAAVQAAREERRKAKAERKAAARAKREAAKAADDRTTLGAALGEEAQRRWDKRRAAEKDKAAKDGKAKDGAGDTKGTGDKDSEATKNGPDPVNGQQTTDQGQKSEDRATGDQADEQSPGKGPGSADSKDGSDSSKGAWGWWKKKPKPDSAAPDGDEPRSAAGSRTQQGDGGPYEDLFGREDPQYTTDRPDRPETEPGRRFDAAPEAGADDDVVDAVIVEDPGDPFGADRVRQPGITTGAPGLPSAPERHTQRPGTSRPTAQEDPVASQVSRPATGQARMAAKHRTDITFGEYLTEIVNIAVAAGADKDRAKELAGALGKVADALRDMAADLVGDHNIATTVVDQITDLADAASRMKMLAERCATECEIASEAALLAATAVGWTYSADMQAMDEAGLAHASSAAHHD
ncbi:ATP/GTP-binding protein [Streptomyces anulatus]|uniref:ATP/GTP-binding protein n=1 Tax=Streptomyces anulatus TaxID=1892 RepID=UPI003407AC99